MVSDLLAPRFGEKNAQVTHLYFIKYTIVTFVFVTQLQRMSLLQVSCACLDNLNTEREDICQKLQKNDRKCL